MLAQLAELYPALFGDVLRPLKRGIFQDLLAAHGETLDKAGLKNPVALIDAKTSERAKHALEAAFLTFRGDPRAAADRVRLVADPTGGDLTAWVGSRRPDVLIVSETTILNAPGLAALVRRRRLPVVTLYWSQTTPKGIGGVDQGQDRIAAHAVDLVVAQLNSNEFGAPDLPRILLFPGRWIAPRVPRRA